jgi:hypothetical protein
MFGLVDGGFKLNRGGVFSLEETGPDLLHQGFERSRCFKVQRPGTAEIRIVWLIRLARGGSLGRAEYTEAHEGGETAEQEIPHQSGMLILIRCARGSKCGIRPGRSSFREIWFEPEVDFSPWLKLRRYR